MDFIRRTSVWRSGQIPEQWFDPVQSNKSGPPVSEVFRFSPGETDLLLVSGSSGVWLVFGSGVEQIPNWSHWCLVTFAGV